MRDVIVTGASLLGAPQRSFAVSRGVFIPTEDASADALTIDAEGHIALPGLVDLHTHLRQPGMEEAETVLTGSQAAALGGFTAVHAMANTTPTTDSPERLNQVWQWGREARYVDVRPIGAVTEGLAGRRPTDIVAMAQSPAAPRVFSDDGQCVENPELMREALRVAASVDAVIAQHSQDPRLTVGSQMNAGVLSEKLGLGGWPGVAEESIIARDVLLAESVSGHLHVCHLSTAGSVEVVAWAKTRGISVTAEVTPHHLLLTEDLIADSNPLFKVNPPLRTREDTLALRAAVASGVIDIIATDHAPHPAGAKSGDFVSAAFGMLGLETALGVVLKTLVHPGLISYEQVARIMSSTPARIGRLAGYDLPFQPGSPAHFTLVDPSAATPEPSGSLSSNNPFAGWELPGRVSHTFYGGHQTVADGRLVAGDQLHQEKAPA